MNSRIPEKMQQSHIPAEWSLFHITRTNLIEVLLVQD